MIESYIAIEGPIGVGKTSLAEIIADKLNTRKVLEDFKDINLHSESGRSILVKEMMVRLKDPNVGWFLDFSDGISDLKNKKRQALGGDYIYSRDLIEGKQLEIFESPDGGETIRSRKVNDYDGGHLG